MVPRSPRISPRVLEDLARCVHPADPPLSFPNVLVIGGLLLWMGLILTAPILLILFLFGVNYTVVWLRIATSLLLLTLLVLGILLLVAAGTPARARSQPRSRVFLLGSSTLLGTICFAILAQYGSSPTVHPRIPVLAAGMLLPIMISLGWLMNKAMPAPWLIQAFRLLAMTMLGLGILASTLVLQADRLNLPPRTLDYLRTMNQCYGLFIWLSIILALMRNRQKMRT